MKSVLTKKLLLAMAIAVSLTAIISTAIQLTSEFRRDINGIHRHLDKVEETYLESIRDALWELDVNNVKTIMSTVATALNIDYIAIESDETGLIEVGKRVAPSDPSRELLIHRPNAKPDEKPLGKLVYAASIQPVYNHLGERLGLMLAVNGVRTLVLALFMIILFNQLISGRINRFAKALISGDKENFFESEGLEHFRSPVLSFRDEIDNLVENHRALSQQLEQERLVIQQKNEALKQKVAELEVAIKEKQERETELLIAKKEVEEASSAKSNFVANTSHELRTPLTAIVGFVELMKAESFAGKNQGKYVEIIERNAKQLLHLVDEILDISGGNEKFYRLNPVPIRLSKIVGDIVANLNALALQKGVTIEVRCKCGEVVTLCDPYRIRQVAYNLIGNAIKFTKSGTVVISCDYVFSGEREVSHSLSVEDTGIGISEKNQKKIFGPFSQADDSTSRQFGGTGLGLAISRKIARLMGGDVVLKKSVEGVGSEFVFTFKGEMPADRAVPDSLKEMSQIEDAPMEEQRLAQKKIIVIDDNNDNLVLIERILSREGALVRTATDAASGISMSTDEVPDLMLLDIQMPDMDGYAAARHLRARGYQGPLIAVTAKAMRDEQRLCMEAGFNAVILKPFDSEQLVGKLVESTDSHYG